MRYGIPLEWRGLCQLERHQRALIAFYLDSGVVTGGWALPAGAFNAHQFELAVIDDMLDGY